MTFPALAAQTPGDPYAGNVPYTIAGLAVADRYPFYFSSKRFIRAPERKGKRFVSNDMRHKAAGRGWRLDAQPVP